MATNLIDLIKGYLTPEIVAGAASYVGESGQDTYKAISGLVPTTVAALGNMAATKTGAQQISQMLDSGKYDGSMLANLGNLFSGGATAQNVIGAGKGLLESLFGNSLGGVTDLIARFSGIRAESASSLMALVGPIIMHVLGRQRAAAGGGMSAMTNLLTDQRSSLTGLLPSGMASLLGWSGVTAGVSDIASSTAASASRATREVATALTPRRSDWLMPLAALAALILIGLGYMMWRATPTHEVAREATSKLAEIQLPSGIKISVPEGAFNFSLATWLASTSDTTVPKRFVFDNLNFESGSTALTPESRPTVDTLAAILKAYPAVSVDLEGYTDSTGDPAANKKLSLDRAASVKNLLAADGVADSRITTAGNGPENPIASNDSEDGRAKNRRLELVVEKR